MFGALNKKLLAAAKSAAMERPCPNCGQKFKPFADRELTSWSDLNQPCTCPKCGRSFTINELARSRDDEKANPKGPFARPIESRIESRQPAPHQLTFYIPPGGRWGIWLFFAIFWNAITWLIVLGVVATIGTNEFKLSNLLFSSVFVAAGVGLAYVALRHRYGATLIELSPETVRLQRALFSRKKNHDLPASDVQMVSKVTFYSQNYQPVYGIEINAGRRRIRFGSALTDDEKNWLCWEIQEFLRIHARRAAVNSAVESLVRRE